MLERGAQRIDDFVAEMYKGLDPRLHGAAGRSVLAHLLELQIRGRVTEDADGVWSLAG